ncbi:MAG: ADOP family duplicated permease [Vicinamibacterales bacterium]
MITNLLRRLRSWIRWREIDAGLGDELEFHRAEIQRDLEGRGVTSEDAARASRRRMGNGTLAREDARQVWIWRWMDGLWQDVAYAMRTFRRDRIFSLVALLTLTLGIGAATAIFSVVDAVVLRPLPYGEPSRLVQVTAGQAGQLSLNQYDAVAAGARTLESVGAAKLEMSLTPTSAGDRPIPDYACTLNLFDVLGVRPQLGRTFVSSDADQHVAVLYHEWWMRQFGGDPTVIGRSITLDDVPYEVIGVMPADFRFSYRRPVDVFIPADAEARSHFANSGVWLTVARVGASRTLGEARAELSVISRRLESADSRYAHRQMTMTPLLEAVIGAPTQTRLFVLLGAVAFVLLIACVNVASLLLTRSHGRARELAVRAAIGAARSRLVRQLLTETMLMACIGGGGGVLLARWTLAAIVGLIPSSVPRVGSTAIDGSVLVIALALSVASGVVSGLAPAWRVSRRDLHDALKDGGPVAAPGAARSGGLFVFAETALALVLLIGAALMIHSFDLLTQVDPGFDASHLVTISLLGHPPPARIRDLVQRAHGLPGVTDVSAADFVPFFGFTMSEDLEVQGRPATPFDPSNIVNSEWVLPGYFRMLGIPIVRGREFGDRDIAGAPLVAIINQAVVRKHFPTEDPMGLRIYGGDGWYQVVGIAKDVRWGSLAVDAPPAVYFPSLQGAAWQVRGFTILARMDPSAHVSLQTLKTAAANALGGADAIYQVQSMDAMIAGSVQQSKFQAVLLGMFGTLALVLAVVGIFGVTSYAVVQRTREIGVRLALGAQRSDMLRLILGGTARPVVAGLIVGLFGAVLATRTIAAFLFQIKPTDAPTYAATAGLFLTVALVAAAIPAYRATQVDPVITLRQE